MDQNKDNNMNETPEFLSGLKDQSSYKVPANYFSEMQASVLDKVLVEQSPKSQRSAWFVFWESISATVKPSYALATLTAVVVGLLLFPTSEATSAIDAFAELNDADLEYYLIDELNVLEGEDLLAIVELEESDATILPIHTDDTEFSTEITDEYITEIEETDLLDFSEE